MSRRAKFWFRKHKRLCIMSQWGVGLVWLVPGEAQGTISHRAAVHTELIIISFLNTLCLAPPLYGLQAQTEARGCIPSVLLVSHHWSFYPSWSGWFPACSGSVVGSAGLSVDLCPAASTHTYTLTHSNQSYRWHSSALSCIRSRVSKGFPEEKRTETATCFG